MSRSAIAIHFCKRAQVIFAIVLALAVSSPSHADVSAIWPTLAPGVTLHGSFTQERHMKGLTAPLKTEGDFVVAPAVGIIWRSVQPVRSVTVITAAGMRRIVDDKEVLRVESAKVPAFAHFYELLDRAIVGDWTAIRQDFGVEYTGDRGAWRVTLTPAQSGSPLAASLTSVVLTGGGRINTVDINRVDGDSEHVIFLNQTVSSTPVTGPDARLLHDKWE